MTFELPSVSAVAQATIRKFAASPLTSTPEFWERIVQAVFDAASIPAMVQEIERLRALNAEMREALHQLATYSNQTWAIEQARAILAKSQEAAP